MGVAVQSAGSYGNVLFRPLRSTLAMVLFQDRPGWPSLVHYHPCESMSSVVQSWFTFDCVDFVIVVAVVLVVSERGIFWLCWYRLSSCSNGEPLAARIMTVNTVFSSTNNRLL